MATKSSPKHVRLIDPLTGRLLREHRRPARIQDEDRSRRTPLSAQQLLDKDGQLAVRSAHAWPDEKVRHASTDDACAMALEPAPANTASRAAIRNPQLPFGLCQVDPLTLLKEKDGIAISQ